MKNLNLKHLFAINDSERINDMAVDRGFYKDECREQIKQTLAHVAKICTFPDMLCTEHWADDLSAFIGILFSWELKNDRRGKVRSKCFAENFIYGFFNKDFSGYEKISSSFRYAIKKEGFNPKDFNIPKLVEDNRERIISFYKSLLTIPHNLSVDESDKMIDACINNFVNWDK